MITSNSPDYVKISSKIFLDKFEEANQFKPSGVLFNKYMTLLYRRLKADGDDIKLPHCWYRWGDEVVRSRMPYLEWDHEYAAYTQVSWRGRMFEEYDSSNPIIAEASKYADEFIDIYSGEEGAELAIDEVYDKAPFPFQNDYRQLRESLKQLSNNSTCFEKTTLNVISPLFEKAMRTFPSEFRKINYEKECFTETFSVMIDSNANIRDFFNITEEFWFFFCYYLRLNNKCHENIPNYTIKIWEEKIPEETELFHQRLQNYVHKYYKTGQNKPYVEKLNEEWNKNDIEFERLLNDFPDNSGEELKEFIHKLRVGNR